MKTLFKNLEKKHNILQSTKLLPILLITGIIHFIYFFYGFLLINNPKIFKEYKFHEYYEKNLAYLGALISLLLVIYWIFLMSKQKSFKSFFQLSAKKIFLQFLCYFFISFWVTSFYYSFNFGLISGIKSKYSNEELAKDIDIVNKAGVFLNFDKSYYRLNSRIYDFPFNELTSIEVPSYTKKDYFLGYKDRKHFFWSVKETEETYNKKTYKSKRRTVRTKINADSTKINSIYFNEIVNVILNPFDTIPGDYLIFKNLPQLELETEDKKENTEADEITRGEITYKENDSIKKAIVNIKDFHKYLLSYYKNFSKYDLDYYNYSSVLIPVKTTVVNNDLGFQEEGYHKAHLKKRYNMNKFVHDILNSKNKKKRIKKIMTDFISLTDKYKVDRNIDAEEWFELVYNEQSTVKNIIFGTDPSTDDALMTYGTGGYTKKTNGKNPYIDVFSLTDIFYPINNFLNGHHLDTINSELPKTFYLVFLLSIIVFTFRISSIKVFIPSLIIGVILLFVFADTMDYDKSSFEDKYDKLIRLIIYYTCFITVPYLLYKKSKFIFGLIFNLGLLFFIPLVYTILFSISSFQVISTKTGSEYFPQYVYNDILTKLGNFIHPILLISGFVFIYCSIPLLKKAFNTKKKINHL